MANTYTNTYSSTYTTARANYIMNKVYEDTLNLMIAGLISKQTADKWREEILYLLNKQALKYFEVQFYNSDGHAEGGIGYGLVSNGSMFSDNDSGGLNFWGLPSNSYAKLLVTLDYDSSKIAEVNEQLEEWGWGTGKLLEGAQSYLKSYSKDGFGFNQNKIGQW